MRRAHCPRRAACGHWWSARTQSVRLADEVGSASVVPSRFLHAQLVFNYRIRHSSLVNVMLVPALSRIWPKGIHRTAHRGSLRVYCCPACREALSRGVSRERRCVPCRASVALERRASWPRAPPRAGRGAGAPVSPRTQLDAHTQQTHRKCQSYGQSARRARPRYKSTAHMTNS